MEGAPGHPPLCPLEHEIISLYQRRLGRMLTNEEGVAVFWDAYHRAPDPQLFNDDRWHLRAPIHGLRQSPDWARPPNGRFRRPDDLSTAVRRGLRQLQYRPEVLDGCLTGTGLQRQPP